MARSNRRQFLKAAGSLASGAALGASALMGCSKGGGGGQVTTVGGGAGAVASAVSQGTHDLCVARGSESVAALTRAAVDGLGGIARFVTKGATVCLKPNASWDRAPGSGANTHPDALRELVSMCFEAGAKDVFAIDHPLAADPLSWNMLKEATEEAGGHFIELAGSANQMWETVDFVDGVRMLPHMGEEQVAFDVLAADVFINAPVLKLHSLTGLSIGLKNLMGVIRERGRYHGGSSEGYASGGGEGGDDIHQAIADLGLMLKDRIQLTVVDCTYVLTDESGPRGRDDVDGVPMMTCIAGTDIVACDYRAAQVFGMSDDEISTKVDHIPLAAEIGVGTMDLASLRVNELDLGEAPVDEGTAPPEETEAE